MKEFGLWALLALPVAAVGLLAPGSEKIARALRSAAAAVMLFALLSPLASMDLEGLFTPPARDPFASVEGAGWRDALKQGLEEGIQEDIAARFSLGVEVCVTQDEEGRPTALTVYLERKDLFEDAVGISHYVKDTYGVECEIRFKEE